MENTKNDAQIIKELAQRILILLSELLCAADRQAERAEKGQQAQLIQHNFIERSDTK